MYSFFVLFSSALLIGDGQAIRDTGVSARGLNASTTAYGSSALGQTASRGPNATSGSPSSLSCGDAWMSWLNRSTRYIPTWTSYVDTYTYHNITAATATGCDGHPRVVGGSGALTTVATGTNITSTSASKNFTVPTPTCQLSPSECTGKLALYSLCTGVSTTSSSDCGVCSIWGGTVSIGQPRRRPCRSANKFARCNSTISPSRAMQRRTFAGRAATAHQRCVHSHQLARLTV